MSAAATSSEPARAEPASRSLGVPIVILGAAQFVMVLDSSVMNVSISQIVADLHTTITGVQLAITAYTLVMAALMITGAKIGGIIGRKRAFGIGDPLLLERRAADLAQACAVPLEALDVGLHNWQRGERATLGLGPDSEPEPDSLAAVQAALNL